MIVKGKDVLVLILDAGVWKPYACGKSCTLDVSTEFIETSITGQGSFATYRPTKHSFSGTLDGIVNLAVSGGLSIKDLRALQLSKTVLQVRFTRTDGSDTFDEQGNFYIEKTADTGTYNDVATFSITIRGTGALIQI